jgi:choline dehydrogenase-like flavoprotein
MILRDTYDAIVVGAGAAGGIMAATLAEAGKTVLLLERGPAFTYATEGHRDHLRNQRYSIYGHNAGPAIDGNPRVAVAADGTERILRPHDAGYQNNAAVVGGGTGVYGGQAWRFLPDDFRMASRYGVPQGSSLTDWPISYAELAPYYERAEWEIGVAGDGNGNRNQGPRAKPYPMPPVVSEGAAKVLRRGAEALGISTFTPPILINTLPRDGRAACIQCGSCVGFPCPSDAKNGTQNTALPRALATGRCDLVPEAMVASVDTNEHGKVIGVTFIATSRDTTLQRHTVRSRAVVLSGGATETARLLLASKSRHHPDGLGNAFDLVGRNLQGHYYPQTAGLFDERVHGPLGPGVSIATTDFNHGNDGVIGGGMLADDFVILPAIFWKQYLPPDLPRWGQINKDFMRQNYAKVIRVTGPVHEIPTPDSRISLDPHVTDKFGLPVLRMSGVAHPETVRTAQHMLGVAQRWVEAAGAIRQWSKPPQAYLSGGQHQAGTCRMGDDPENSVTDKWGTVWGHDNLVVSDGSLHPTNGGFNPVLTIMALAYRNGEHLAAEF